MTGNDACKKGRLIRLYFVYYAALGIYLPYLSLYLKQLGMSGLAIGSSMGLLPVVGMISPLLWGWAAERWGKHAAVMAVLLIGAAVFLALFTYVHQFIVVVAVMLLFSFFINAYPALLDAETLNYLQSAPGQYGRFRLWGSAGYGIGGGAAMLLTLKLAMGSLFLVSALLLLLGAAITMTAKEARNQSAQVMSSGEKPLRVHTLTFVFFLLLVFLLQVGNSFYGSFFGIYIHDLGGSQSTIGMATVVSSVCELPFFYFASQVVRRWGAVRTLMAASLFYVLRWGMLALFPHPATAVGSQLLHGCTFCLYYAAALEFIRQLVPERSRTGGIALFTATVAFAGMIGNVINGFLYDAHGVLPILYSSVLFALLAGVGYGVMGRRENKYSKHGWSA